MYASESSRRLEDNYKPRKIHNNNKTPSFSSTLLDEIYRSTDEKSKEKPAKKQTPARNRGVAVEEDGDAASFRRRGGSSIDKWMTTETNKSLKDNDLLFFSSTSSSSDSSGALSDTEFFGATTAKAKPKASCFTASRPKPIRTNGPARDKTTPEDHHQHQKKKKKNKMEDDLRSRALKVYAKLKDMKQPISPGARLTSFITTLFNSNGSGKKSRNIEKNNGPQQDLKPLKVTSSSSSKSCLSKFSPNSRAKMRGDALKRTVRFHPAEETSSYGKPPLPPNALEESEKRRNQRSGGDCSMFRSKTHEVDGEEEEEEDEYDAMSDSSSDLFEIDHLSLFGNSRFCEELPVYETTDLETNRAVVSGLIRR